MQTSNEHEYKLEGESMLSLAKELFPLNRSLMGPDIRKSLKKFSQINNEFKQISFFTQEKVFDWEIPEEWIINDAYIEHESGKRFAEFKKNNLHLMGYSIPVNKIISNQEFAKSYFTSLRVKLVKSLNEKLHILTNNKNCIIETKDPNDNRIKIYKADSSIIKKKIGFLSFLFKN